MTDTPDLMVCPRTPSSQMIAAAWNVIDRHKRALGIAKLGPGLGVRELWEAMFDAAQPQSRIPSKDSRHDTE